MGSRFPPKKTFQFTKESCTCKSDAELMDFMKKKHFIFSYNKLTFLEEEFDDDKVIKDFNNLDWLTIDISTPYIRPYKVELTNL